MSILAIVMLAFSMSMDAFVVSVSRGAAIGRPRLGEALRTGLVFGIVEAITPLLGWAAGAAASSAVEAIDHWLAFGLLCGVGLHMTISALRNTDEDESEDVSAKARHASLLMLIVTAVGTSLDAMAVGVSLAFLDVNIVLIAAAIGLATCIMSTAGIMLGRIIGTRWGRYAEAGAGLVLVGLGVSILMQHLVT